jgi:predicted Rossmann fold nucleotide-binding protein DprA/Smf involved in DNA uptake
MFGRGRLEALLGRGFLLSQAVERWNARAIWVVSRADTGYPRRLKARLKEDAPPVLYGCGSALLLEAGGLAVVGSRDVNDELISYTENVGRLAAEAGRTLISGGAKGIDRAAMNGALQARGSVVGVMADSLERGALARDNREPLMDNNLVLISPYDPAAGFNVGHAMQRNKLIYALADAALVVTSDFEKGGTWAGAIEQLERLRLVPVFVRNGTDGGKGNTALLQHGARTWPNPQNPSELCEALSAVAVAAAAEPKQETLSFALHEQPPSQKIEAVNTSTAVTPATSSSEAKLTPSQLLFSSVRDILRHELIEPKTERQVAELLDISKSQASVWLKKLIANGEVEKINKPLRYRVARVAERLL